MQRITAPKKPALGRINSWLGGCSIFVGDRYVFRFVTRGDHDAVSHWGQSGGGFREGGKDGESRKMHNLVSPFKNIRYSRYKCCALTDCDWFEAIWLTRNLVKSGEEDSRVIAAKSKLVKRPNLNSKFKLQVNPALKSKLLLGREGEKSISFNYITHSQTAVSYK